MRGPGCPGVTVDRPGVPFVLRLGLKPRRPRLLAVPSSLGSKIAFGKFTLITECRFHCSKQSVTPWFCSKPQDIVGLRTSDSDLGKEQFERSFEGRDRRAGAGPETQWVGDLVVAGPCGPSGASWVAPGLEIGGSEWERERRSLVEKVSNFKSRHSRLLKNGCDLNVFPRLVSS